MERSCVALVRISEAVAKRPDLLRALVDCGVVGPAVEMVRLVLERMQGPSSYLV